MNANYRTGDAVIHHANLAIPNQMEGSRNGGQNFQVFAAGLPV
jgi:hypothetical protein